MDGQLTELSEFLSLDQRIDVKASALDYVLGFTGNDEGCQLIMSNATFVNKLLDLTTDRESLISRDAFLALLNLSANDESATKLNQLNVISQFLQMLTQPSHSSHIKQLSMLISNLTRQTIGTLILINSLTSSDHTVNLTHLIDMFDKTADNDTVDYLAPVFSNITQDSKARQMFLDQRHTHVPRLMSYVGHQSLVRRGGTIGCLRNLTFEVGHHEWLLSIGILPALLLPLAGPEELNDEENDQLPIDCQYLPSDKKRESDPELRVMLLESITKLCATKYGRNYMRGNGVYFILRELHKWEEYEQAKTACENLVSILISDEPNDPSLENLDDIKF